MNILILTQIYFPEPHGKMMHILSTGLIKRGHKVTVITSFPNYPLGKTYPSYHQKIWQHEKINGVHVIRLPIYPDRSHSAFRRILNYASFSAITSILGPFLCGKIDIILVYSPPITLGIPVCIISLFRGVPFIFEIQDMWPETLEATGFVSNKVVLKAIAKFALFIYLRASAITVISPGFKKNLKDKGVLSEKINVIYNWAYEGNFQLAKQNSDLARKLHLDGHFNILYAGNIGPAQGLHNIIEAASLVTNIKNVQFVLMGSGIERERLEKMVIERKMKNILFLPRQPIETMKYIYPLVDVLMIHLTDDPLFEITIPGKTQSYLLSGRPVIVSVNKDAADLIIKAGAGLAVRAMDPIDLACAVRKLYYMSPQEREIMGLSGRAYYFQNLSPEVQIYKYEQLFYKIVSKNKRKK
ncbi:glycosyltransferase family 4 protein [bacterium]|nr:glycosyltransferase family 4 protein [bacterium]